jgi:hypothetical protein
MSQMWTLCFGHMASHPRTQHSSQSLPVEFQIQRMFLGNISSYKRHTESHPRRQDSSKSLPVEFQIQHTFLWNTGFYNSHMASHPRIQHSSKSPPIVFQIQHTFLWNISSYKCHMVSHHSHSHFRENLKSYIALAGWALQWRRNVSPVRYELGCFIPEDRILHNHHHGNLKC